MTNKIQLVSPIIHKPLKLYGNKYINDLEEFEIIDDIPNFYCQDKLIKQQPPYPQNDYDLDKWFSEIYSEAYNTIDNRSIFFKYGHDFGYLLIRKWLKEKSKISIADAGCGVGRLLDELNLDIFENYYGFDVNQKSLTLAKQKYPELNFIRASIDALPLPNSCLDYFVSIYTLELILNLSFACYEIIRVLKNNGELWASIPIEESKLMGIIRKLTSCRTLKKKYNIDFAKIMFFDHLNYANQIIRTLSYFFDITYINYFPFQIPVYSINLVITIKAKIKPYLKKSGE